MTKRQTWIFKDLCHSPAIEEPRVADDNLACRAYGMLLHEQI